MRNREHYIQRAVIGALMVFVSGCAQTQPQIVPPQPVVTKPHPAVVQTKPQGFYHIVNKGETLWRIAQSYNVSVDEIIELNRLPDPEHLEVGQRLFITAQGRFRNTLVRKRTAPIRSEKQFVWPLRGKIVHYYGTEVDGVRTKGIDIRSDEGEAIHAAKSGVVSFVSNQVKGFGKMIIIDHSDNFQTVYAHNKENTVEQGNVVKQGDVIGYVGKTGRANVPLFHFEIRRNAKPVDPLRYLPR